MEKKSNLPKEIVGKRIKLKEIIYEDREDFFAAASNPEITQYLSWEYHKTIEDTDRWIEEIRRGYREGEIYVWGIFLIETGKFIGYIGFDEHYPNQRECEIGYWLAKSYHNRGYMTEALEYIVDYCINILKYNRITAMHALENSVSGKVMEKCGFKKQGIIRNCVYVKERMWDTVLYSIENNGEKNGN